MFTGIVQAVGHLGEPEAQALWVHAPDAWPGEPFQIGESIAVSGCCLTVTQHDRGPEWLRFDVTEETLRRTSLGARKAGDPVNLERAMRASDRFGGHIVQGHVDGVGRFLGSEGERYRFQAPPEGARFLIDKGSISIEGVSLTVVDPVDDRFDVWLIPHTLEVTNLGSLKPGDPVNMEYDVLAKHVEALLRHFRNAETHRP